jgi:hypothetical protein
MLAAISRLPAAVRDAAEYAVRSTRIRPESSWGSRRLAAAISPAARLGSVT